MDTKNTMLSRGEKIMLAIYEMSAGKKTNLKFEDIVVSAFKKFPEDFHLRGYPAYPDSGDLVHKPLYDFRKKGYLEANNKVFCFTERGLAFAQQLASLAKGKTVKSNGRLSRFAENEILRIEKSEGFVLYVNNRKDNITETDFYGHLSITPRTSHNDFIGRLQTVEGAIKELAEQKNLSEMRRAVIDYHKYLMERFGSVIESFKKLK